MSEKLRGGLEQQIERFLKEHPGTALIVIDTLQRIRSIANDVNPYASDYRDLGILKELADRHRIAILLIHHLRKMNDDDPMNMISGTTGISGATDSNFVLRKDKRGGSTATLYCTGRDIEYRELTLEFDTETHIWKLLSDSVTTEPRPQDKLTIFLSEFLSQRKSFTGTATELAEALAELSGEPLVPGRADQAADPLPGRAWRRAESRLKPTAPATAGSCVWLLLVTAVTGMTGKPIQAQYRICCHSRHTCHGRMRRCPAGEFLPFRGEPASRLSGRRPQPPPCQTPSLRGPAPHPVERRNE
jgi:hypothetical protein